MGAAERHPAPGVLVAVRPVVVVSGPHGAGRSELGASVASRLGYALWDREILHEIALQTHMSERLFDSLDEHRRNPITEALSTLPGCGPGDSVYVFHLQRTLRTIAAHGSAVVIGRGAQFVVSEGQALRVRIVSPLGARVRAIMHADTVDETQARREIERVDDEHAVFVRQHYARDLHDVTAYDLLVNTATLGVEGAASVVEAACRARFGEAL